MRGCLQTGQLVEAVKGCGFVTFSQRRVIKDHIHKVLNRSIQNENRLTDVKEFRGASPDSRQCPPHREHPRWSVALRSCREKRFQESSKFHKDNWRDWSAPAGPKPSPPQCGPAPWKLKRGSESR